MHEFLRMVPLFASLPEADLELLSQGVEEVRLPAKEVLFAEGSPGDRAYVIKEGTLEVVKTSSGREVLLNVLKDGEVIGEMALLLSRPRGATIRARTDATLLTIHQEQFKRALESSSSFTRAMLYTVLERWQSTESLLRQSEKMAQLGTLTAGVAHELNNPAAAVKRGADQLRESIMAFGDMEYQVRCLGLTGPQEKALKLLAARAQEYAVMPAEMDALARSDREHELEEWLEKSGVANGWELAPTLVNLNYEAMSLSETVKEFSNDQLSVVLRWLNATYTVYNLLAEIGLGSKRISDIVKALKSYSYLDQAPVQQVDVHEELDNTLLILRSKLKAGIQVKREYAPDLPRILAYGSELTQVWTNIIDNAADALEGKENGRITIRTRRESEWVVVEIEDNGPGIPPEIQSKIFDTFFTTKPPGKGTGLGLDITYKIVVHKHRGDIRVASQPGKTVFAVWLPINFESK